MSDNSQPDDSAIPPWALATEDDFRGLDFESPITGESSAHYHDLADRYFKVVHQLEALNDPGTESASRAFAMISALLELHFKPEDRTEPYGPTIVTADGKRSAVIEDFSGRVDALAYLCETARNALLRARFADVCWLVDRKRHQLARQAVAAYVEIVTSLENGNLGLSFEGEEGALGMEGENFLRRAFQISYAIGLEEGPVLDAKELVIALRKRAFSRFANGWINWFITLDLDFAVSNSSELGKELEDYLLSQSETAPDPALVELWRLAARAYHQAKNDQARKRCRAAAAECCVSLADMALVNQGPSMVSAHWLSVAIAELHGIGRKERRLELRHRLVDVQASIPDEMSSFGQNVDLSEIVSKVEAEFEDRTLLESLFVFAALERSPDPVQQIEQAKAAIAKHPLSAIFGTSYLDRDGKVIHRTEGGLDFDGENSPAVRAEVAQQEEIRRMLCVHGQIEIARQAIVSRHSITEGMMRSLLKQSPFVPPSLIGTFCRGFIRFFHGDFISALYILVPLLENSLRHVLMRAGHDVTTFDDATSLQEDRSLSSLIVSMATEMRAVFGAPITNEIDQLFNSRPGPALRHAVAHGLLHDGSPFGPDAVYACWFIFRLCLVPLFPHWKNLKVAN